jgi:hypothetical protein
MNHQAELTSPSNMRQFRVIAAQFSIFFLSFIGGLAATRILFELFFPALSWIGRPYFAFPAAALVAFTTWRLWFSPITHKASGHSRINPLSLFPLLFNLIYLTDPTVDLIRSRFIFFVSLWLVFALILLMQSLHDARKWWGIGLIVVVLLPVYLLTMSAQVGRDDVFEFQVVTPKLGIVHPTGYPLYLMLGKLFTFIPFQSIAWRLNFASVVYAMVAVSFLFLMMWRVGKRPFPALIASVLIGLSPTLWSQAIQAEVYALNALIVAVALWLMAKLVIPDDNQNNQILLLGLAATLGLGLTNHLTTVILIPAAALTFIFLPNKKPFLNLRAIVQLGAAFVLPLLLYAYLPLRWQAVVGEPMGFARFVDWVIGGRFRGALQLMAWLRDPTRYEVVGRLFLENWGWFNLVIALLGLAILFWKQWRIALILLVTWLGYVFYNLNYYVPDLAVFLLPAQIVVGICWGIEFGWLLQLGSERLTWGRDFSIQPILVLIMLGPAVLLAVDSWRQVDLSVDDGRTQWGTAVLSLPLAENSAILADSDKYPQLFYLQQNEGLRPDLDISVWPDEAAYRAQLSARLEASQTVYLARFLPGLEGQYHLRSVGPLTEVSPVAMETLPSAAEPSQIVIDGIRLVGFDLEPIANFDETKTAVTFYWQADAPVPFVRHVYVRWLGEIANPGQHPANNYYPTGAWSTGEIVSDFHLLPTPILTQPETGALQVALAPPFTDPDLLDWQTVAEVDLLPSFGRDLERPFRIQTAGATVTSAAMPNQVRPQQALPVMLSGTGEGEAIGLHLEPVQLAFWGGGQLPSLTEDARVAESDYLVAEVVEVGEENGRFRLSATHPQGIVCGWMQLQVTACTLGEIEVSGVPIPAGATNFDDQIALLDVEIENANLQAGGQLDLTLHWQSLAAIDEDYTVFVQVLDAQDRLVGQVDAWPLQGTFPTSQWVVGEAVVDPYAVQLDPDLPPGEYRLQVGMYLLATLKRLPVVNVDGNAVDDKFLMPGLNVVNE